MKCGDQENDGSTAKPMRVGLNRWAGRGKRNPRKKRIDWFTNASLFLFCSPHIALGSLHQLTPHLSRSSPMLLRSWLSVAFHALKKLSFYTCSGNFISHYITLHSITFSVKLFTVPKYFAQHSFICVLIIWLTWSKVSSASRGLGYNCSILNNDLHIVDA